MYLQKQKNPLRSKYPWLGITALGHQCTRLNAGVLNGWAYVGNRTTVCPIERSFSRGQKWAGLHIKQRMQLFWCASCAASVCWNFQFLTLDATDLLKVLKWCRGSVHSSKPCSLLTWMQCYPHFVYLLYYYKCDCIWRSRTSATHAHIQNVWL